MGPEHRPWRMGLACCAERMGLWLVECMTPRTCTRLLVSAHKPLCPENSKAEQAAGALWAPYELSGSKPNL